ncbi:ankyrin repeat-containing protein NPR4 [Trifolium repens]|nr:ankyrin repeat-containing protein NPR4 [Trifolium repens]
MKLLRKEEQCHLFEKILDIYPMIIHDVDNQNKNVVLLAIENRFKPWRVPGAAMQMKWECKWYNKLDKNSMPSNFYEHYNNDGKTAKQVFIDTHRQLVKEGSKWLTKTSE